MLRLYSVLFFGTAALSIIGVGWALTRQHLRRIPILQKMYILALLPGVVAAQMACALWGRTTLWIVIAGTVLQVLDC